MTHEDVVDMKDFNEWWDRDIIRSSPFRRGSPKYWAWAAWEAALREHAMRELQRFELEMQPEKDEAGQPYHWNVYVSPSQRNQVLEEMASEIDKMKALGDTAASFASFVRGKKV